MAVAYLPYNQIDKIKWDLCIEKASNGQVYGYSYYLDAMADNWDGLVLDNYEAVMPLTWKKKYGIHYLYQPPFTAAGGVFGKNINADILSLFLQQIPAKFKYIDISLNHGNFFQLQEFNLHTRMNYVLSLNEVYENIYAGYRDNIKRNIKKSEQYNLQINKNILIKEVIDLSKKQAAGFAEIEDIHFDRFEQLYNKLYRDEKATAWGVYSKEGSLLSSAVFFFSHNRAFYIMVGNHPNGKTLGASHALINAFIKDHAGQQLLLDFEGSDIPSLAFFYSSFGAVEEKYSAIKLNKLPTLLKWMK